MSRDTKFFFSLSFLKDSFFVFRSTSVSRGLQVETDDLIQFSNGRPETNTANNNNNNSTDGKKAVAKADKATGALDEDDLLGGDEDEEEEEEEEDGTASSRTADEQMDYLESLEPCPCYAKCCIDSVITLFCVTLLG